MAAKISMGQVCTGGLAAGVVIAAGTQAYAGITPAAVSPVTLSAATTALAPEALGLQMVASLSQGATDKQSYGGYGSYGSYGTYGTYSNGYYGTGTGIGPLGPIIAPIGPINCRGGVVPAVALAGLALGAMGWRRRRAN